MRLSARSPVLACCLALLMVVGVQITLAQDAGEQPADAPAAAETTDETADAEAGAGTMTDMLLQMDWAGWTFMGVLFAFSLFGTTVAIERLVNLRSSKLMPARFCDELHRLVVRQEEEPDVYRELAERSDSPIAHILSSALLRVGRPVTEVEKAMEDAAARELSALRGRNRPLSVVGNVAPLVGLLGTVFGMIMAFRSASQAGLGKAEVLAEGIYLALLTTAAGLSIAIPSLIVVAYLNARVERFTREMDETLMETMPAFAGMEKSTSTRQTAQPTSSASENLVSASS